MALFLVLLLILSIAYAIYNSSIEKSVTQTNIIADEEKTIDEILAENNVDYEELWNVAVDKVRCKRDIFVLDNFEDVLETFPENQRYQYSLYGLNSNNAMIRYISAYLLTTIPEAHDNQLVINRLIETKSSTDFTIFKEFSGTTVFDSEDSANGTKEDAADSIGTACDYAVAVLQGKPCYMSFFEGDSLRDTTLGNVRIWKIGNNYIGSESLWIRKEDGYIVNTGILTGTSIYDHEKIPGENALFVTYGDKRFRYIGIIYFSNGNLKPLNLHPEIEAQAKDKLKAIYNKEYDFTLRNSHIEIIRWIDEYTFEFAYNQGDWGCYISGKYNIASIGSQPSDIIDFDLTVIDNSFFTNDFKE